MHADMEIQSAAKLPTRHLRCSDETGARSALKSGLDLSSANCAGERSDWMGFMIRFNREDFCCGLVRRGSHWEIKPSLLTAEG